MFNKVVSLKNVYLSVIENVTFITYIFKIIYNNKYYYRQLIKLMSDAYEKYLLKIF